MAGFCGKCGNPLDDTQAFCARCGAPVGGQPVRPAAPASTAPPAPQYRPPQQPAPYAPAAGTAAPAKSGNTLVKVLLILAVVIFVFGAIGIAGIWYVAHKAKQKFHEIGLDEISSDANADRGPALGGVDPCSLLSKSDVGLAANAEIVRAEASTGGEPGCSYNVLGDPSDLVVKHASLLHKEATTDAERQQFESASKNFFRGMNQEHGGSSSRHPGEAPIFVFNVSNAGAKAQMNLSRMAFGSIAGGMTTISGLGDDAIDIGGAMMLVRKDDKLVRVMYMMCPCTTADVTPLVKKIVANMD
jgi:hypothetical protein